MAALVEDALHNLPAETMTMTERLDVEDVHVQAQLNQSLHVLPEIRAKL